MKKIQKKKLSVKGASSSLAQSSSASRQVKRLRSEEIEDPLPYEGGSLAFNGNVAMSINSAADANGPNGEDADNNLYCFCQRVSFGEMIGCDNEDCKYEWFHWSCVGITSPPKDDEIWYCPDCASKMEKRKRNGRTECIVCNLLFNVMINFFQSFKLYCRISRMILVPRQVRKIAICWSRNREV